MQVLEAGPVAADDDQVHPLLVLDLEVAHGAIGTVDREAQRGRAAARERGRGELQAQAVVGDGEAADRVRLVAALGLAAVTGLRLVAAMPGRGIGALGGVVGPIRPDGAAGDGGHAEHDREDRREAEQLGRGAHAGTAS